MIKLILKTAPLKTYGAVIFLVACSSQIYAQNKSEISVNTFVSSLFIDSNTSFFDGVSLSTKYQKELGDHIDLFMGFGALSAIQTKDELNLGLDRFSVSILSLNSGFEFLLFVKK